MDDKQALVEAIVTEGEAAGVKSEQRTTESVTELRPGQDKEYFGFQLGKPKFNNFTGQMEDNGNLTIMRKHPKIRGKAAVKAAKRARRKS